MARRPKKQCISYVSYLSADEIADRMQRVIDPPKKHAMGVLHGFGSIDEGYAGMYYGKRSEDGWSFRYHIKRDGDHSICDICYVISEIEYYSSFTKRVFLMISVVALLCLFLVELTKGSAEHYFLAFFVFTAIYAFSWALVTSLREGTPPDAEQTGCAQAIKKLLRLERVEPLNDSSGLRSFAETASTEMFQNRDILD